MTNSESLGESNPPEYCPEPAKRHPRFYFSDDLVLLQIQDTQFKVHKPFLFNNSSVFRDIFRLQITSNKSKEGPPHQSEDSPIFLDSVTVPEFEALLTYFYDGWQEGFTLDAAGWAALLAIAHRFKIADAELRAQREIFQRQPPLDAVEQVALAEEHAVPLTLLAPALKALVQRKAPPTEKEFARLSSDMITRLATAREDYVREASWIFATPGGLSKAATDIVEKTWHVSKGSTSSAVPNCI
ncbi:hypothetical protein BC834DRAFT_871650 [Gloeopeniophorella convolvens]|nr:hypothetical protein BC834DRAFT_910874 [Gloeopeniophorella convolvens]KAI0267512.1 hypothetical protein BC834DRAFT_871650 [Gloeopeniophorella convolvens]